VKLGFCIALGGRARNVSVQDYRLRLLCSLRVELGLISFGLVVWALICCTGSNTPLRLEMGAVFVCALRSDLDGLLE
jgi:hypothetical protein